MRNKIPGRSDGVNGVAPLGSLRGTSSDSRGDFRTGGIPRDRTKLEKLVTIATATRLLFAAVMVGGKRSSRCDGSGDIRWGSSRNASRVALAGGEPWWIGWCRGGRFRGERSRSVDRVGVGLCEASVGSRAGETGLILLSLLVGSMLALYASLLLIRCDAKRSSKASESHYAVPAEIKPPVNHSSLVGW